MFGIARHGNAPFKRAAADRKIAQTTFHEGDDLIAPCLRPDEVGIVTVMLQQRLGHGRELEEIIFFANGLGDATAVWTGIAGLGAFHERFVGNTVLSGIGSLVDETAFLEVL